MSAPQVGSLPAAAPRDIRQRRRAPVSDDVMGNTAPYQMPQLLAHLCPCNRDHAHTHTRTRAQTRWQTHACTFAHMLIYKILVLQ